MCDKSLQLRSYLTDCKIFSGGRFERQQALLMKPFDGYLEVLQGPFKPRGNKHDRRVKNNQGWRHRPLHPVSKGVLIKTIYPRNIVLANYIPFMVNKKISPLRILVAIWFTPLPIICILTYTAKKNAKNSCSCICVEKRHR